ncbi:unnamed protein product [Spirodela intermedia]|uniref:Auxin-responsive protein n=1 Tax=Spirodela intermedia TaxID=51605 RepID=A0A7I8J7J8_SPIIN|nr:unnamed protein product [Spirodela intermedia]CAA6666059.1 unnamed protein product [Spirodela intermedia]
MEAVSGGGARGRGSCPKLLDLIPNGGDWSERDGGQRDYGVAEEQKLELRLGLPGGEDWRAAFFPSGLPLTLAPMIGDCPSSPVVGWPPIRSFRKNLASSSFSKPSKSLVKINMDGMPIGRKIDLKAHSSYDELSSAVNELFRGLIAAQRNENPALRNQSHGGRRQAITGLLDGSGEHTLVYEDNEGDVLLVGDVPWDMFVAAAKRLRMLKSSELSSSLSRERERERKREG